MASKRSVAKLEGRESLIGESDGLVARLRRRTPTFGYLLGHWPTIVAVCVLALLIVVAFGGSWLLKGGLSNNASATMSPPKWAHPLGTDWLGRDQLSRIALALKTTMIVAAGSLALPVFLGVPWGILAGYRGGWLDTLLMRGVDVLFAFPALLLAMMVVALLGTGTVNVMIAIGVIYLPHMARVARGPVLTLRGEDFTMASRCAGARPIVTVFRHIVPNAMPPIIVQGALVFSAAVLTEATLSFLGLGAQPPVPTLGGMVTSSRPYLESAPWLAIVPGLVLALLVSSVNVIGDGLREAFDPRLRTTTVTHSTTRAKDELTETSA